MALSFQELIRFILDGQNVDAATINNVLRSLDNNTRYVKDMFDAALSAEALFDRDVTCEEGLLIGMPAYFNPATKRFERAIAATYFSNGLLRVAESSYPWGIVSFKHNTTRCDILLCGVATLDITAALLPDDIDNDGNPFPGVYYLSGTEAGKMQLLPAPVGVPICQVGADDSVYVRPNLADIFTRHLHYQYPLLCRPAGTANLAGGRWTIAPPDPAHEGWLPANHASFGGKAPAGAIFGYNLAQSPIGSVWPPLPLEGVYVAWDRGTDPLVAATGLPLGPYGLVTVDENGLWWNSNLDNDVPWPANINTATTTPPPPGVPESPRTLQMRMSIYFTKPVYQTGESVVTSLVTESPMVSITCASDGGSPASTGPLQIDVNLALAITNTADLSAVALKTLAANGGITSGPVTVGIKSNTPSITITSDQPALPTGHKIGLLDISANPSPLGGELPVVEVKLDGATLENYKNVMSLGLLNNRDASFRGEYHIPKAMSGPINTKVRFWLLGRKTGNLPDMTLTARVIPQPDALPAQMALPLSDTVVAIDTSNAITIDNYIEVESAVITAPAGASVQFTFARNAEGGDGYDSDVLVLKRLAVIVG